MRLMRILITVYSEFKEADLSILLLKLKNGYCIFAILFVTILFENNYLNQLSSYWHLETKFGTTWVVPK